MAKDYYVILGVPVNASDRAIRSAFRELARRHHPDHAGSSGARAFQEAEQAYRVLSDPTLRAAYDLERELPPASRLREPFAGEPRSWALEPVPLEGEHTEVRPSAEALLDRLLRGFRGDEEPKSEHEEPLEFELLLNPEEAEHGVLVPFEVPVLRSCGWCGGSGSDWGVPCRVCDASGSLLDRETVHVRIPSGVRSGTIIEASLARPGTRNVWLRLHTRIARH